MTGNGTGFGRGERHSLPGLGAHSGVKNESRQCVYIMANGLTFRRQRTVVHQGNVSSALSGTYCFARKRERMAEKHAFKIGWANLPHKMFFVFFNWISLVPYFIYRCCGTILWKCKVPPAGRCACFCSSTKSQWLVCIEQWNGGSWVVITSWQKTKCKM